VDPLGVINTFNASETTDLSDKTKTAEETVYEATDVSGKTSASEVKASTKETDKSETAGDISRETNPPETENISKGTDRTKTGDIPQEQVQQNQKIQQRKQIKQ
jgi:hypothetical protein